MWLDTAVLTSLRQGRRDIECVEGNQGLRRSEKREEGMLEVVRYCCVGGLGQSSTLPAGSVNIDLKFVSKIHAAERKSKIHESVLVGRRTVARMHGSSGERELSAAGVSFLYSSYTMYTESDYMGVTPC